MMRSRTQKLIESIKGQLFKFSVLAYKHILYFAVRLKFKFDLKYSLNDFAYFKSIFISELYRHLTSFVNSMYF